MGLPNPLEELARALASMNPLHLALLTAVVLVLLVVGIVEVSDWARRRSFMKLLEKNPEAVKALAEAEARRAEAGARVLKMKLRKRVKVVVLDGENMWEDDRCWLEPSNNIVCRRIRMSFIAPPDYRPKVSLHGRRAYLTFYFDRKGNAVEINDGGVEGKTCVDPVIKKSVVDSALIERIFRSMRFDATAVLTGVGLGAFIAYVVVFFLLPIMGIPVTVGRQPVEVRIAHEYGPPVLPPGNYTIPGG